jgi:hypothetical protein
MKKIVDYFPFFIEKELLELRVNLLKNHVDKFIISELNKTHNGDDKDFICKKVIDELNLPKDKIEVIETTIPDDEDLIPDEIDYIHSLEAKSTKVKNWTRERLQRDALMSVIGEYNDDVVFISSDCDEIINPEFLSYFSSCCRNLPNNIIKVPLVLLEGRGDNRLYDGDVPADWSRSFVLCTKKQLINGGSPTKFRGEYGNSFDTVWITENEKRIEDCGWHFTWMGDENLRKYKAKTTVLSDNLSHLNTLSLQSMKDVLGMEQNNNLNLKNYSVKLLPQIIFDLPSVKNFLLPQQENSFFEINTNSKSTCWAVDNFYENPNEVRKFALEQSYLEGGLGRGFIGRRTEQQFLFPGLKERFEEIVGRKITKWEEHGMNGRFQVAWSGEPLVYHCDNQQWGGMLYLTPDAPYSCGTSLYGHKQTRARTYYDEGWDAAWTNIPGDPHLDGTPFEPVDVLGNVYNRLVIFDASCIHSASQYFGTTLETGRLWQMFFFDTE